jgi:hypothetical protein
VEALKRFSDYLGYCMLAVTFLNVYWDGFPTMAALYAVMTGFSILFGAGCLRGDGHTEFWDRRGVPAEAQRRFSRIQGALYLVNAAICPVGLLANLVLDFDQDFVLLAQILGLAAVSLLGLGLRGNARAAG